MLTKNLRKLIRSLDQKKYRKQTGLFVVEGIKNINDLLQSDFNIQQIIIAQSLTSKLQLPKNLNITVIPDQDFGKISLQKNPQKILALVHQKKWNFDPIQAAQNDLILVLDNIQDPGNMGTIMRTANWFNIPGIVASENSVDIYNPKVVQASMGAIFRIPVVYENLPELFGQAPNLPIYGTFTTGQNIYTTTLQNKGFIVMGNEANGISPKIENLITTRLTIPAFNPKHPESLNVAIATGITLSEFRRRTL